MMLATLAISTVAVTGLLTVFGYSDGGDYLYIRAA